MICHFVATSRHCDLNRAGGKLPAPSSFWAHLLVEKMHEPSRKKKQKQCGDVMGSVRRFLTNTIDLGVMFVFKASLRFSQNDVIVTKRQNNKNMIRKKPLDKISV